MRVRNKQKKGGVATSEHGLRAIIRWACARAYNSGSRGGNASPEGRARSAGAEERKGTVKESENAAPACSFNCLPSGRRAHDPFDAVLVPTNRPSPAAPPLTAESVTESAPGSSREIVMNKRWPNYPLESRSLRIDSASISARQRLPPQRQRFFVLARLSPACSRFCAPRTRYDCS